jgi:hypothetical protein
MFRATRALRSAPHGEAIAGIAVVTQDSDPNGMEGNEDNPPLPSLARSSCSIPSPIVNPILVSPGNRVSRSMFVEVRRRNAAYDCNWSWGHLAEDPGINTGDSNPFEFARPLASNISACRLHARLSVAPRDIPLTGMGRSADHRFESRSSHPNFLIFREFRCGAFNHT